jgi:formylmethanofuran dehydrogenase subunit C
MIILMTDHILLKLISRSNIPIEADTISPDHFLYCSLEEIAALPVYYGRRKKSISDLFDIRGANPEHIIIEGDLAHVKKIGYGMTKGSILIRGNAGMHTGAYMSGGEITIEGDVSDNCGTHMKGGIIRVSGNAGHMLGGAYPGAKHGMNRGTIIVEGRCGNDAGAYMRRGLIVVKGSTGDFTGVRMVAGTIMVFGRLGKRAGANMKRGSIISLGSSEPLLPTFRYNASYTPAYINMILKHLHKINIQMPHIPATARFHRYSGDINTIGKGEIILYAQNE